ncbi:MAG: signal peptidase I [Leptospira sp.]|nr:signal peptidase I [Leptospira sp.]
MSKSKNSVPLKTKILNILVPLLVGLVLSTVFKYYIISPIHVENNYMEPTYKQGDTAYVWRIFRTKNLKIGDVVLSKSPLDANSQLLGRIVGKAGDRIEISKRIVLRNNSPLEPNLFPMFDTNQIPMIPAGKTESDDLSAITVPEKTFFIISDNLEIGVDSRTLGPIPENLIIGKL